MVNFKKVNLLTTSHLAENAIHVVVILGKGWAFWRLSNEGFGGSMA